MSRSVLMTLRLLFLNTSVYCIRVFFVERSSIDEAFSVFVEPTIFATLVPAIRVRILFAPSLPAFGRRRHDKG